MDELDVALTVINVILAFVSGVGSYKSAKYYRKSRNLTILAQTNKALIEVQKMLNKLPDALSASNIIAKRGRKGFSLQNTLCEIGNELNANLTEIYSNIPTEHSVKLRELQSENGFNLQNYINSFISGEAINEGAINSNDYNRCQERLLAMQEYLKKIVEETEEKLK